MALGISNEYSSTVQLALEVDGELLGVAQVCDGRLMLREPKDLSDSSTARLIISVDGEPRTKKVVLPEGSSKSTAWVKYYSVPDRAE
jgi:hypothetical protein